MVDVELWDLSTEKRQLAALTAKGKRETARTSDPARSPVFSMSKLMLTTGLWRYAAADEPSAIGVALRCVHRASSPSYPWSDKVDMRATSRFEYSNVV